MRRDYIVELVTRVVGSQAIAESVVDVLSEEGLLNLHYGNQDIGEVITAFSDNFHSTKVSKYDRFAAKRLADKHGAKVVVAIIDTLAKMQDNKFCPTVNSVSQLETKFPQVVKFIRNNTTQEVTLG